MDTDSSTKFIGSLTKFLQSLCNGYVEFQRGVELVGHIYLSIDTGEKVDYILHEKVNKSDENSVTFVSNSYHAQPLDKDKASAKKDPPSKSGDARESKDTSSDDDIMIVDQTKGIPGSTNSGTIPSRGVKRVSSPNSDQRQTQRALQRSAGSLHRIQSSSNPMSSPPRNRQAGGPAATVTSQDSQHENLNVGDMKLEQISTDELLSLASQVGDGAPSHLQGPRVQARPSRGSVGEASGQPVWIKQEAPDDLHGGPDTGWSQSRDGQSDSSNSSSNLYPVMMHQNPGAFSSNPVFPGFPSMSGSAASSSQPHGLALPGTSGGPSAANPYANPMPGTSGGFDPADAATAVEGDEELQKVCEAVMRLRSGELTLRKAAELYGIPRSTLSDRVVGRVRLFAKRVIRRKKRESFSLYAQEHLTEVEEQSTEVEEELPENGNAAQSEK